MVELHKVLTKVMDIGSEEKERGTWQQKQVPPRERKRQQLEEPKRSLRVSIYTLLTTNCAGRGSEPDASGRERSNKSAWLIRGDGCRRRRFPHSPMKGFQAIAVSGGFLAAQRSWVQMTRWFATHPVGADQAGGSSWWNHERCMVPGCGCRRDSSRKIAEKSRSL